MKRKKRNSIPQLKRKLTKVFNQYIRCRDLKAKEGRCISCQKLLPYEKSHAGHFIPSTYSPVRFDEMNVNGQCIGCNNFKHGNLIEYRQNLIVKYGEEAVKELESKRNEPWKWDRGWLELKIEEYKEKLRQYE